MPKPRETNVEVTGGTRRSFLSRWLGAGACLVAGSTLVGWGADRRARRGGPRPGPEERSLHEADFYRPHGWAG